MIEYLTDALVLDKKNAGEMDSTVYLYTRDLGKVIAKAKSSRKITSKLGGHLEPLNLVKVRLVEKNGFQVVDALALKRPLSDKSPLVIAKFLRIMEFIKEMTFECQRDFHLWVLIKKILASPDTDEKTIYRSLLKTFGFDPKFAECVKCRRKDVYAFIPKEQKFLCRRCAPAFKIPKNEVIFI